MPNLIGSRLRLRQAQVDAWKDVPRAPIAGEDTIIHINDEPRQPFTVALLIRSAALQVSD